MTYPAAELEQVFAGLLRDVGVVLDANAVPWMLVGGLAVGAWTEPRGTKDCDLAVSLPSDHARVDLALRAIGLIPLRGDLNAAAAGGVVRLALHRQGAPPLVLDLLCAGTPFEHEALARRRETIVLGTRVPVVSPDDLVIYKLIAGRPQDLADIDRLLRFGRAPENEAYLRRWAREWDVEEHLDRAIATARR